MVLGIFSEILCGSLASDREKKYYVYFGYTGGILYIPSGIQKNPIQGNTFRNILF